MRTSDSIGALAQALSKAQASMALAAKDSANPFFKSRYLSLAGVWDAIRSPLGANGLAVIQATNAAEGGIELVTRLCHASGEWVESTLFMPAVKTDPQSFGSLVSYARRYSLMAIVGVAASDDDDAESAMPRQAVVPPAPAVNPKLAVYQAQLRACRTVAEVNSCAAAITGLSQDDKRQVSVWVSEKLKELKV